MKMGYIYELHCPLNDTTMYIGQTSKNLKDRLRQHISKTKLKIERNKFLSKKEKWINNLIQLGIDNDIKIIELESCDLESINEREVYWISEYNKNGYDLTNTTPGGHQCRGYTLGPMSIETKKKISDGLKNSISYQRIIKSEWNRKRASEWSKKYWKENREERMLVYTDEYRSKISEMVMGSNNPFYNKKHSNESKSKMSESKIGVYNGIDNPFYGKNHSDESKIKISEKLKLYPKKLILIYDLDMNFVKECDIYDAMEYLKCNTSANLYRKIDSGSLYKKHYLKYKNPTKKVSKNDYNLNELKDSVSEIGYRKTSIKYKIPRSTLKRWLIS